jgi:hypothetical protein
MIEQSGGQLIPPKRTVKATSGDPIHTADRLNAHNELIDNSVIAEINATARWFATLKPKHQDKLLKRIGARRVSEASS